MTPAVTEHPAPPRPPAPVALTPTLIASTLYDGILARWRHHWIDHGHLCGSWLGGPVTPETRAELLIMLADVTLDDIQNNGAWSVVLDATPDDEQIAILVSDRRFTYEIPFSFSSRALRVGDRVVPLGLADSGRRILELVVNAIGDVLGSAPAPVERRRKGRRHDA